MNKEYKKRISLISNFLKKRAERSAFLISSAPVKVASRDQDYPYSPDRDFYYLTGLCSPKLTLLISNNLKKSILFVPKKNPIKEVWEGSAPDYKKIAKSLNLDLVENDFPHMEIIKILKSHKTLYFNNIQDTDTWNVSYEILSKRSDLRATQELPVNYIHSDAILENARAIKSLVEVKEIQNAAHISFGALKHTIALLAPSYRERDFSTVLECNIKLLGGQLAFANIIASGKSAATLHYNKHDQEFKKNDLVLIDFGASYNYYNSDITRVFPVSGVFNSLQAEIYDIVLKAQLLAIKKAKNNVLVKDVYDAAVKELTIGLKELGVLSGNISNLIAKKAYLPYFPHGIGHSLGLDTHDIGNFRANNNARLVTGMVFTIEPGLYFSKKIKNIPACGIRIEDDILITNKGNTVLTDMFPKERNAVEEFLHNIRSDSFFDM